MRVPAARRIEERVLCVDLDGTLIRSDLLWESLLSAIRTDPMVLAALPWWLIRGRACLKRELAAVSNIDFTTLPYREEVLSLVRRERNSGRRIVLATASEMHLADSVARHLGEFDEVLASDGTTNLKGHAKAVCLNDRFGAGNYDYIGDSMADAACWENAADAITVKATPNIPHLRAIGQSASMLSRLKLIARALRPHQWLKNLLLVVPAVAAHQFGLQVALDLVIAFITLSLCASGGYVLNDLLDLTADRRHSRKRHRPFASGQLSIGLGLGLVSITWLLGLGLAVWLLPLAYAGLLVAYLFCTMAYSIRLKKEPVLDVMFLAGLYVVRVIGGGAATGVFVSSWLLAFTLFVCLSLAFLKRFIEVWSQSAKAAEAIPGRGYIVEDAAWIQSAGITTGYLSVLVLAIYVNNPDVTRLYAHPERLLSLCPLLMYGITRTWLQANRRRIHDDPLVAVASDRVTYVLMVLALIGLWTAI